MTKFNWTFFLYIFLTLFSGNGLRAQNPPVPDGRRLREIIADKYQDRIMLIGGTTGAWALGTPTGKIMDREFNYVTPENDFKQSYIHPDNGSNSWNWNRPDAWKSHVVANDQVLRMHGPVSPQCSNWAKSDNRTPQQLETNMRAYMEEQCKRYNAQPNFEYLDVINEVVVNGTWHKNKEGTDWEMPWFIIGQDNDKNKTPLFIKYAFEIANEHAPDLKLVINQHEGTINKSSWDLIFETVQYLRDKNLRVDGIGWQAHVGVGWEEIEGQQQALRDLIDRAHASDLEFHITECNVFLNNNSPFSFKAQAHTFKAILDVVVEKSANGLVTWNTWNIDDGNAWQDDKFPTLFDSGYRAKPAYYAVQLALETKGDYSTKHNVKLNLMNTESGAALQNCRVTFNNDTITTNENGEAIFYVTAGFYSGMAEKRHFNTTSFGDFSVYSDTTFTIALDSAEVIYDVNIHISDEATGESLSAVNVTLGDKYQTTGVEGALAFNLNPGSYAVDINKTKYSPVQTDFLVQSDTIFFVTLKQSHADIKFRVKEGSTPVNDALVIFNGDTLYTSALGFCTFRTVGINKAYSYSVEHEFFKTYEDRVEVSDDTTLNLQLEKTVANIEFQLAAEGETIENPIVVINDDTTRFDENMKARLYNLPIDATYEYRILSGNFATHPGSVWLQNDTVVNIVVVYTSMLENSKPVIKVYPNPAKKILRVSSKDVVAEVKIFDAAGRLRLQKTLESMQAEIDVSALNQGLYLISFLSGDRKEIKTRQFIIQR